MSEANFAILFAFLFSFLFPLGLLIWWKCKTGAKISAFLVGALIFIIFAALLESAVHTVFLLGDSPTSRLLNSNPFAYMVYGSLMAGLFEETGRFVGFRLLLKNKKDSRTAVAYGIGHGGIEVALILGATYGLYLLVISGVNLGTPTSMARILENAQAITFVAACVAIFERIGAVMIHIGLSMIVFTAVHQKGKLWRYTLAILLHALVDAPVALMQKGVITSVLLIELYVFAAGILLIFLGRKWITEY